MRTVVAGGVRTFVSTFEGKVLDRIAAAGTAGLARTEMDEREQELARNMIFRGIIIENDDRTAFMVRRFERDDDSTEGSHHA